MEGLAPYKRVAEFRYDFAKHGGAVGDIVLDELLPKGAIVTDGMIHVTTAVLSGGSATVALKLLGTEDILAATAKATLALNAKIDAVPDGTSANMIRCTAATGLTVTIATAALTAGAFTCWLEYYLSQ